MARTALPVLELDDPLRHPRPQPEPEPESPPATPEAAGQTSEVAEAGASRSVRRKRPSPAAADGESRRRAETAVSKRAEKPASAPSSPWREWGRGSRTATYRLPEDLLDELDARARQLGLPLGLTVAAGILQVLDQDDDAIVAVVDRVEDARVQARRLARKAGRSPST